MRHFKIKKSRKKSGEGAQTPGEGAQPLPRNPPGREGDTPYPHTTPSPTPARLAPRCLRHLGTRPPPNYNPAYYLLYYTIYCSISGVNPGEVLGSGPHQLFALPRSAYWWTKAQFSQNISVL